MESFADLLRSGIRWAATESPEAGLQFDKRTHRAQVLHCPPLAPGDGQSRCGPGQCTNWLIPGRLLCGEMPEPRERTHQNLAAVTHFVDLTELDVPLQFRAQAEARALAAGVAPPTFVRHTIEEFSTGSADAVLAAVSSVMQALAEDPTAVVYLHCRAGHGRTGMVAALVIGLTYPTLSIDEVMTYIQEAHDDRIDSWNEWRSPETDPQRNYARTMIDSVRQQIKDVAGVAAADTATQRVCRWCEPALLVQQEHAERGAEPEPESEPEPEPEPQPEQIIDETAVEGTRCAGLDVTHKSAVAPWCSQHKEWPTKGNVILAHYDAEKIVVYQAFNQRIAEWAVRHQRFGGPHWQPTRMTWIKTNFLWMQYRCGWGTKDENQTNILAITISRTAFEQILAETWHTNFQNYQGAAVFESREEWQKAKPAKGKGVRLQWDPDHTPVGGKQERHAIQLGMTTDVVERIWNRESCIKCIHDITPFVEEQRRKIEAK
eukprot:COSAG01_NODE_218_length_21548_cov_7.916919_4_plen_489_part_00